ncbi:MAG: esterase-like activity of phytase family protein [Pseudomonadota bacterium]
MVRAESRNQAPADVLDSLGDRLSVEAIFSLTSEHDSFGGLSGLWIAADGSELIAVSDIGQRWHARPRHDENGRLTGLEEGWTVADLTLGRGDGEGTRWIDSEAVTRHGEAGLVVAYEGEHRLRRWPLEDLAAPPVHLPLPEGLGGPSNSGMEALATLSDGRLFAIAEDVGAWGGDGLMGWVIDEATAADLVYRPGPGLVPTGADRLDETVYVVERQFSLLGGFKTRIASLPADAVRPGARLQGSELALFRWGRLGENFEGIAARRGADGRTYLYLIADDNFSFLQETLLVQLSLRPSSNVTEPIVN